MRELKKIKKTNRIYKKLNIMSEEVKKLFSGIFFELK